MKSISEFILEKMSLNESLSIKELKPALNIIKKYFTKRNTLCFSNIDNSIIDGEIFASVLLFNTNTNRAALLLWKQMNQRSVMLDGVVFMDNFAMHMPEFISDNTVRTTSRMTLKLNNASLAKSLPMINDVLTGSLKYTQFDEQIDKYKMFESVDEARIDISAMEKESSMAYRKWYRMRKSGKASEDEIARAEAEYREKDAEYKRAMIKVSSGETVEIINDESHNIMKAAEEEYEERATPQEKFSDMERYIKMVVAGLHPGLIICGAPGIGKTHRVMKYVKTTHEYGNTLDIIKGRCTTAALYTSLFNYSKEGDLIVIDDADEVFAESNSVNLLKAALDSGDERLVSYGTTRPPELTEDEATMKHPELEPDSKGRYYCPKSFFYEGNIIFITNLRAGQLDTALRSRCYICELDFTVEESLEMVREIMLTTKSKHSMESKQKAYDYLKTLVEQGAQIEVSMRTFGSIANLYQAGADEDERQFKRMVKDFVFLQAVRGGKRF
jgi:plastocyanin